jgi:hypothetical protein
MSDTIEPNDVEMWSVPDGWLASLIRRLRGMSPDQPLPPGLLESWRRHVAQEIRRHAVARARRRPAGPMPRFMRAGAPDTMADLILDLLATPEGQFWMQVAAGMPSLLAACAAAFPAVHVDAWRARRARDRKARDDAAEIVRYLVWKGGGAVFREDPAWPLWARYKAACNAVTVKRASAWRARLADTSLSLHVLHDLLAEVAEVGRNAINSTAPLRIWDADGCPPRGLLPDPPEPEAEDDPERRGGSQSAPKPPPVV